MTTQAVVPADEPIVLVERNPAHILKEAQHAAGVLSGILKSKPDKVMMNGQQYLEFEDWQVLGRFYGTTARAVGEPEYVELPGGIRGFKATSEAVDAQGRALSRASAYCLTDEDKWGERPKYEWAYVKKSGGTSIEDPGKSELVWEFSERFKKELPKKVKVQTGVESVPLFQLASMAQTRANAKCLRNVLSWVAVIAGYGTTPAEEIAAHATVQRAVVDAEPVGSYPAPEEGETPVPDTQVRLPGGDSPAWTDGVALASECLRLRGGDASAAQVLFKKATGADSVKSLKPEKVREGWSRLADIVNA